MKKVKKILSKLKYWQKENRSNGDSLSTIVKIMEYIHEYENVTQTKIEAEFEPKGFAMFIKYCIGEKDGYADIIIGTRFVGRNTRDSTYTLNQQGYRKLHELRKILAEEKRAEEQKNISLVIAFTGAALAFIGSTSLIKYSQIIPRNWEIWINVFTLLIGIVIFITTFFFIGNRYIYILRTYK